MARWIAASTFPIHGAVLAAGLAIFSASCGASPETEGSGSGGVAGSATAGAGGKSPPGGTGAGGKGSAGTGTGGAAAGSGAGGTATGGTGAGGAGVGGTSGAGATGSGGSAGGAQGGSAGATTTGGAAGTGGDTTTGGAAGTGGGSAGSGGSAGGGIVGDMPLVYEVENTGADCPPPPAAPAFSALPAVPNMPDPFLSTNGTRISKREEWRCRRAEISAQMQHWVSGPKGAPPSDVNATLSGNRLSVVVTQGGASITLTANITTPSGDGPFPLLIGMNTSTGSLPSSLFAGVATMTFTSSQLVPDGFNVTRGAGTYFTMYPDDNAAAMIEWAWGVSRLIDGLYETRDQNKIDLKRIGVTGCSYQGKMSLYAGAFDERIALVIPQESGGGGEASWRVMATQSGTEDLEAAQGTAWYAKNLKQFRNADAPKLPVDMHELVAMVAPRAILTVANTGIARLGSEAGYASMKAAAEVYKALGIPQRIGFTQTNAPNHCSFPSSQSPDVQAFVDKYLLGEEANTAVAKSPYMTDMSRWITWTTPTLE